MRGGETKLVIGVSFLGDCWDRKRDSSMTDRSGRKEVVHAELAPWAQSLLLQAWTEEEKRQQTAEGDRGGGTAAAATTEQRGQ